jgi:hypothetical protein
MHYYYRCRQRWHKGKDACQYHKIHLANKLETHVWELISELLKDPQQLRADLDRMIELERSSMRGDPDREQKARLSRVAEADRKRARHQEMADDDHHLRGVESQALRTGLRPHASGA